MTGDTALDFDRWMLKNKRPSILGMALDANLILRGGSAQLFIAKCTVGIMTIGAVHQPFIYPVVERTIKIGADISVAGVAKRGLRGQQ